MSQQHRNGNDERCAGDLNCAAFIEMEIMLKEMIMRLFIDEIRISCYWDFSYVELLNMASFAAYQKRKDPTHAGAWLKCSRRTEWQSILNRGDQSQQLIIATNQRLTDYVQSETIKSCCRKCYHDDGGGIAPALYAVADGNENRCDCDCYCSG